MNIRAALAVVVLLTGVAGNVVAKPDDSCMQAVEAALKNKNLERAEVLLGEHLAHAPEEIEARFLLARVYSWQNKWQRALAEFDWLLTKKKDSADFLLARANVLEWMGRRKEALRDLEKAREVAPQYSELWRTEIIVLQREGSAASRSRATILINQARKKFPDIDWEGLQVTEKKLITERNRYSAEFSYGYDKLTNGRSPWVTRTARLSRVTPGRHFAHVQLDSIERFDLADQQLGGSYALPVEQSWSFYVSGSYSPTHKVLANRMLDTNISKNFSNGAVLSAGASHARYNQTSSQQIHLGGEYYWSDFRLSYTYRRVDVLNAGTGMNHNIQLNRYYSRANMAGVSVAGGTDVEFDGTANPPVSDVLTFSVYGNHMLSPQWSLVYSLLYHHQGDFYNRNGIVLGIKYDF